MIIKGEDNARVVAGRVTRDAELRYVGEKNSAMVKFGIAAGKRKDTTTIFVDCLAWRELAESLASLQKGDYFAGMGTLKGREYNGKTYYDLVLEWGSAVGSTNSTSAPAAPQSAKPQEPRKPVVVEPPPDNDGFIDITDDGSGDELPF